MTNRPFGAKLLYPTCWAKNTFCLHIFAQFLSAHNISKNQTSRSINSRVPYSYASFVSTKKYVRAYIGIRPLFNVPTDSRYVVIQESDPKITCILMIKLAHLFASIRLYLHPACGAWGKKISHCHTKSPGHPDQMSNKQRGNTRHAARNT